MSGKVSVRPRVLITGGASGIGAAIAQRCIEDGYETVVLDHAGDADVTCDLSDPVATSEALKKVLAEQPITRLVNNVGTVLPKAMSEQSLEEFDAAVALNLRSAFLCAQTLLPGMRAAGFGRIISISSRAALGKVQRAAYSATKAGLHGLTRTLALEEGPKGITANVVAPGPIRTKLFSQANPSESPRTQKILNSIPVGRMGSPEDIAHTISYLLDERSSFVTGQILYVCGGMTVGAVHD